MMVSLVYSKVKDFAQRTNMHRFLSAVNAICVRELGFPEEHFPVPCPDEALASRVLGDILSPEWQGEIPPMRNKLRYEIAKTRRLWHNRWKYRIVYDETLWQSFWTLARNRVGVVRASSNSGFGSSHSSGVFCK